VILRRKRDEVQSLRRGLPEEEVQKEGKEEAVQ